MGVKGQDEDDAAYELFKEPEDFYQPAKEPTFAEHKLLSGEVLNVRLVGHNPLWGHFLWNAGRTLAVYLEEHSAKLVNGRTVLELGAGGGLPSLVAALNDASTVVVTDYPDAELIENLSYNIDANSAVQRSGNVHAEGYLWGATVERLLSYVAVNNPTASNQSAETGAAQSQSGFDTLILGDLLFNHSEHAKLIDSIRMSMKCSPESVALVFFTPYRPWLLQRDLAFFELAREAGFDVHKVFEIVMDKVMFEQDPGDELLRRTVYGYELRWKP